MLNSIISLAKRRGFVYPTSEIYGGLANSYDYGPLGAELLRNIRNLWWKKFIHQRDDMVGIDTQIIQHPNTWRASGHVDSFTDPLAEDKKTHKRYRADHLIENWIEKQNKKGIKVVLPIAVSDMTTNQMAEFIKENNIKSPEGNDITAPMDFNLLFETRIGAVVNKSSIVYLRGETAQGIFVNFAQVVSSTRVRLPFGIGQIGKSFRNEITLGQFIFRTLEFEQAEIEYFFDPKSQKWQKLMQDWRDRMWQFVVVDCCITDTHLRWRRHSDTERSHYSKDTYDLEYKFPFGSTDGFTELWGVAYRTDYDLKQHMKYSKADLSYTDPVSKRTFVPHVIEPALGINRVFLMLLAEHYRKDDKRVYLALPPKLAPNYVAVFPLLANKKKLVHLAKSVHALLKQDFATYWDDRGNIGKRYRYQDEIGTPWCVTIDFNSLESNTVTVRERDSMRQERVCIDALISYLKNK